MRARIEYLLDPEKLSGGVFSIEEPVTGRLGRVFQVLYWQENSLQRK